MVQVSRDILRKWLERGDVDERRLMQIARLAELGLSVAATAHDLRQPLSALKMTLQILRERIEGASETSQDIDEALRQVARVETLVERTRNMFAPPQGMGTVDLAALAEEICGGVRWAAGHGHSGGARLEVEAGRDLPKIHGDRALIEQLVMNLVNNARDAVEERGGGKVLLAIRRVAGADADAVEMIIADTGAGIRDELAEKIFDPFFTTKDAGKGTGLGLYIVKRVAEDHGAKLELMGRAALAGLDRGALSTGFRLVFPGIGRADAAPAARVSRSSFPGVPCGRRALVVEDEPVVRKLIVKLLEREGFECAPCETGDQAITAIEAGRFDLVVADKNLPGASGIEVLRRVRRRDLETRVVITTGYPSESSVVEAMALGVDDYFLKPLDVEALRATILGLFATEEGALSEAAAEGGGRAGALTEGETRRRAFIAEPDMGTRRLIEVALRGIGFEVETNAGGRDLGAALGRTTSRILIARPELLDGARQWLRDGRGRAARFGIAIVEREGVDAAIAAIRSGARGVLVPPFTESVVGDTLARIAACIDREGEGRS
jgi:CheY-like chemotaxis protein